jgi:phage tail-like protein
MATADRSTDPLTSFNFIVDIQGIKAGFMELDGISNETNVIEYRNGNEEPTMRKIPGQRKYGNITLKRGFTTNGKDLWKWRMSVINGKTQRYSGTITLLDESRKPSLVFEIYETWPCKLTGPGLNAKNNDAALEIMEIVVEGVVLQS